MSASVATEQQHLSNDRGEEAEGFARRAKPPAGSHDKPANGLAGLRHWRHDLRSGFMVALISLPFSMGIAITSGAPPVCGIVSAIIAGFLLPFLGGSYVTVSGPAAGLAPVLYGGIVAMGHGDLAVGYPRVLAAICVAGCLQLLLAKLKVARLSAMFPAAAIEGMLAAIGLMIIVKQAPLLIGQSFHAHEFWEIIAEIPARFRTLDPQVFGLGVGCVALIFALSAIPSRLLKVMPPAVWAFVLGTAVAQLFLNLDARHLIHVPESPLANGIVFPDFASVWSDHTIWVAALTLIVTLVLIDGAESLATIAAVDKLDPYRRKSDPDRTLSAMGASNVASSLLGGLTIIPGIVKSTANIIGGGRTQWANFYNACFLLTFLFLGKPLIDMVPTCVLASILVFVGYKLCRPKVWLHMAKIGREQFVIFATTIAVTVTTDLLLGIIAGVAMKFALCLWYHLAARHAEEVSWHSRIFDLVRNPVERRELFGADYYLYLERPLVCFNLFHLIREMDRVPAEAKTVTLKFTNGVTVVDHTTCENLFHYLEQYEHSEDGRRFEIHGLERMRAVSSDETAIRLADYPASDDLAPVCS